MRILLLMGEKVELCRLEEPTGSLLDEEGIVGG